MPQREFVHYDLIMPDIPFSSTLADLVIELEHFRIKPIAGTTHPVLFTQLREIFQMLESIGSARIEGNNTTVAEFIETKLENTEDLNLNIREIVNIEQTMAFIEENRERLMFDKKFIIKLYESITAGLPSDIGVEIRGEYRKNDVSITGAAHIPPNYTQLDRYMQELINFINYPYNAKYDLIKIAIAHHRFVWVHPFNDGNGRTVRMITHAMLIKSGFGGGTGRIVNPTAVFCNNRKAYYNYLAEADKGTAEGLIGWCEYVLYGLKAEMEKVDRLLNYDYLKKEILLPALYFAKERQVITGLEMSILRRAVEKQVFQASDIREFFNGKDNAIISRHIKRLIEKKMLVTEQPGARKYIISFNNNYLLRGIMKSLDEKGFLPVKD
jgi:Fic family protein